MGSPQHVIVTDPPRADTEKVGRLAGQLVRPGDAIIADDDGVVCVPREALDRALDASQVRIEKEAATRQAYRDGELGLDRYGLRTKLKELGVEYVAAEEYGR